MQRRSGMDRFGSKRYIATPRSRGPPVELRFSFARRCLIVNDRRRMRFSHRENNSIFIVQACLNSEKLISFTYLHIMK